MNVKELWDSFNTGIVYETMVEDIMNLLKKYKWKSTKEGIEKMLEKYLNNKGELIKYFVSSPHYNGNLQIVCEDTFECPIDRQEIANEVNSFLQKINANKKIVTNKDEDGKTFGDLYMETVKDIPYITLKNATEIELKEINSTVTGKFTWEGKYLPSVNKYTKLSNIMDMFASYYYTTVDSIFAERLNRKLPKTFDSEGNVVSHGIKAAEGQKTSRAFNKAFVMFGFEKDKDYLKEFPVYADLVKDSKIDRVVVLSINPIDYLTMSFGNTWASCHTIDRDNSRHMPNSYSGGYCGGTLSYMLDECSIVAYCPTNQEKEHPERESKIYRNMIHFKDNVLIQSRMYPQSNDGALDLYKKFREIEQREISTMLGIEHITGKTGNDTWIQKGKSCDLEEYYDSDGVHYRDYECSGFGGNISIIRGTEDHETMYIGSDGICPVCGRRITDSGRIVHYSCND